VDDCSLFWAHGTAPAPAPAPRVFHIARMRTSSLHRGAGTASATGTRCATGGGPQHYHRRAQAPTGAVGHERGARPSDVTLTPSRSQVASICHGRAHQSCVYSLARCVLCARVCERALSQVRQQVRGSTRDHRHSPSQHQHTTTQNSAAVTGTQPIEVRSAPTCLVSRTACRLSRPTSAQARPLSRPEGGRRSARPTPQRARRRASGARQEKKDTIIIFFLHITKGNGGPVAGVGGTKMFWGRVEKKDKIFPPPHSLTPQPRPQSRPPPGPRSPTCRWVSPRSPPGEIASWRTVQLAEACKHLLRSRGTVATRHPDEHSQKPRATSRLPNTSRTRSSHRLETLADLLCSPLTYSPARTLKRSQTNAFARRLATPVGCRALPVPEGWMRTRPA
jgi:hypothetical protein